MTPTARGYRGPGHGMVSHVEAPAEWRATTVQACGLWPWAVGAGSPTIGTPIGRNLTTGSAVCFDPLSWFTRARLLLNPSAFVLGLPALGKSTLTRRLVIGAAAAGTVPMVLGDLKPDYVDTVRALGGQVLSLGRGAGSLNPLDAGALDEVARVVGGKAGQALREEAHGRRFALLRALLTVTRGARTLDQEDAAVSASLRLLAQRGGRRKPPLLSDLVKVLEEGPEAVRAVTLDRLGMTPATGPRGSCAPCAVRRPLITGGFYLTPRASRGTTRHSPAAEVDRLQAHFDAWTRRLEETWHGLARDLGDARERAGSAEARADAADARARMADEVADMLRVEVERLRQVELEAERLRAQGERSRWWKRKTAG